MRDRREGEGRGGKVGGEEREGRDRRGERRDRRKGRDMIREGR